MSLDLQVPFGLCQEAFGLPGVVTRPAPDDDPIETVVIWVPPDAQDVPRSSDWQRRETNRILAISRADVPTVPKGTTVVAPEVLAGAECTWRVVDFGQQQPDHVRVHVVKVDA